MAVVTELFRSEDNGTLSFGDYTLAQKAKKGDIQFEGDIYKIKTFKTMTKLDKKPTTAPCKARSPLVMRALSCCNNRWSCI